MHEAVKVAQTTTGEKGHSVTLTESSFLDCALAYELTLMQGIRIEQRTFHGLFAERVCIFSGANAHSSIAGMGAFAEKRRLDDR